MKATQTEIAVEAPPRENRQCPNCRFNYAPFAARLTECELFGVQLPPGVDAGRRTCLFRQPTEDLQGQLAL